MNIFLIGYRCTGKTSVGKTLAEKLKWKSIDADEELVKEQGKAIADIVADQGWSAFRALETSVLKKICRKDQQVVATGGGVILDPENVQSMKEKGMCIWLKASPETIKDRIVKDQKTKEQRPSLTSQGLLEEIEEVLSKRIPLYKKAMDFSVGTDDLSVDQVCGKILVELDKKDEVNVS